MPTGYTADITEETTFAEFAMRCARAFGATILMRDDPLDAPIPERFEGSGYSARCLAETKERLSAVRAMTDEECENAAATEHERRVRENAESLARVRAENAKYSRMAALVNAWHPPTPDHVGMKTFMLEQLRISMMDESYYTRPAPPKLTGEQWRAKEIASLTKDVAYHAKEDAEEIRRTNGRNNWIAELRNSLRGTP